MDAERRHEQIMKLYKSNEQKTVKAVKYPANFDWGNVYGYNYIPPVRNQASCGSCFAFAGFFSFF